CESAGPVAPEMAPPSLAIVASVPACQLSATSLATAQSLVAAFNQLHAADVARIRHLEEELVAERRNGNSQAVTNLTAKLNGVRAALNAARADLNAELDRLCE